MHKQSCERNSLKQLIHQGHHWVITSRLCYATLQPPDWPHPSPFRYRDARPWGFRHHLIRWSQDIPSIPSISSSRRLSLNPWQSHAVTDMIDIYIYIDMAYIMTYHDIRCIIKCKLHTLSHVHRSHKMKQIGMYWNLTEQSSSPESGYCLPTVQQRSSKLSRSPWRNLEKQTDKSYSVALIPCRMISLSQKQ